MYLTRRDPSSSEASDPSKPLVVVGVLALSGFLLWRYVLRPKAAPPAPGGTQPGPGPGNVPADGGGRTAEGVSQGDTILVAPSALASVLGGASVPSAPVEMVVTGASPGLPVVLARTTGNEPEGVPAGVDAPVPRAAITSVRARGGASPAPAAPPAPSGPEPAVDLGDPIPLEQGARYRARLELGAVEASLANRTLVAQTLKTQTSGGFGPDLRVFGPNEPLPSDWPPSTVVPPSNRVYYAEGTWGGSTGPVNRPSQAAQIWRRP